MRSLSCAGLGVKRNEAGWQALEEALEQAIEASDGTVREGGTEILGRLVRDWPGDAEAHQARLLLQQLQQDPDHQVIPRGWLEPCTDAVRTGSQVFESAAIPFVIPSGSATLAFGQVRQHTCWNGDRTSGLSRGCWAIGT